MDTPLNTSADTAKAKRDFGLWQPGLFLVLLALSVGFGLHWHGEAHAKIVPDVANSMTLDVFEQNASTPVNVSARVTSDQVFEVATPYFFDDVEVTLSAAQPTKVLLVTGEPAKYEFVSARGIALPQVRAASNPGIYAGGVYYLLVDVGGAAGTKVINFHPHTSISLHFGRPTNAVLPQISLFSDSGYLKASYVSDAGGLVYEANAKDTATDPASTSSYSLPSGIQPSGLFFAPTHLSTSETLVDGGLPFQSSDVDELSNVPSSGSAHGSNFVWQSSDGGMAPLLRTVPKSLEDGQARDEFLSGVALATAAAALIALVQAGPRRIWPIFAPPVEWAGRRFRPNAHAVPAPVPPAVRSASKGSVIAALLIISLLRRRSKEKRDG